MRNKIDWDEVLDVFVWALDKLTRPTFNNLMRGFEEDRYRSYGPRIFHQLEREKFLRRHGKGKEVYFVASDKVKARETNGRDPEQCWAAPWDGRWWLLTFDIPQIRNKDRMTLWRQLSARHIGNL